MLSINLNAELEGFKNKQIEIGELSSLLKSANFQGEVEVVASECVFSACGNKIISAFQSAGLTYTLTTLEDESVVLTNNALTLKGLVIAVGETSFLNAISAVVEEGSSLYLIPTSPALESVKVGKATVFIDEQLILKSSSSEFALAFLSVMAKPLALIDFKMRSYLSGQNAKSEWFSNVKSAVSVAARLTAYKNYKTAIICSQLMLMLTNASSSVILGGGEEAVYKALNLFAGGDNAVLLRFTALEKTAKLYHMFFSNDFSDLLSMPNYADDVKLLASVANVNANEYIERIKPPSNNRLKLIYLLIEKTRVDFLKETGTILKSLAGIKKLYLAITKQKGEGALYVKHVKNAVRVAPYLCEEDSVLTLCRDMGVLKCIN